MISKSQYTLNNTYNLFLTKLVLWYGLYNRHKADKEQGFHPIKNYEKMITLQATVQTLLPSIEKIYRENIRSYFPLIDDLALIKVFKDTYHVWAVSNDSHSIYLVSA